MEAHMGKGSFLDIGDAIAIIPIHHLFFRASHIISQACFWFQESYKHPNGHRFTFVNCSIQKNSNNDTTLPEPNRSCSCPHYTSQTHRQEQRRHDLWFLRPNLMRMPPACAVHSGAWSEGFLFFFRPFFSLLLLREVHLKANYLTQRRSVIRF